MQNVKKIQIDNKKNRKRQRRRQKNMIGYYILVGFLALSIGISLSVTFLFNIKDIVIVGNSQYDIVDIIKTSDISKGDNLIRLDSESARKKILSKMLYMDDVDIKKKFPDKLEIKLYPSKEMAYVQYKDAYILISEKWRILEDIEKPDDKKLLMINGFEPKSGEPKSTMISTDNDKEKILHNLLDCLSSLQIDDIRSIDISDKYNISLNYAGRINIIIGNSKDIEYKLKYAYHIVTNELRQNKRGYLIYRDSLEYSYVSEEEYNMINDKLQKDKDTEAVENGHVQTTDIAPNVSGEVTDSQVVTNVPEETQADEVVSDTENVSEDVAEITEPE